MNHKNPNILFLFTDQLRADAISALGNSQIKTPNIDRLINGGTAFTQCYTPSPVCIPARHALTSGVPAHLTGCVDNVHIECERPSFIEHLNDLGYQTHGVGKMHFNHCKGDWGYQSREYSEEIEGETEKDDYKDYLKENGYDHILDPHGIRSEYYYIPQPSQLPDRLHNNAWVADRSIEYIKNRDSSRPFFLWSSFIKPHPPFESPVPWSRLYRMHEMEEPFRPEDFEDQQSFWNRVQNRYKYMDSGYSSHLARMIKAAYYSTVSHVDYHIGRILDGLGSEIDNTLIVFSADHGEMLGDYGCYGKRSMLDASVRVPMVAQLKGTFESGATCDHASTLLDLFPTFLEVAGGKVENEELEGVSLQDVRDNVHEERFVFSQFSQNQLGLYMAASREWKYIYSAADDKEWLYKDGCEDVNLAGQSAYEAQLVELRGKCIQRFVDTDYLLPVDGKQWRKFPKMELASGNDEGLLFQDPSQLDIQIRDLGLKDSKNSIDKQQEKFNLLGRLAEQSKVPFGEM